MDICKGRFETTGRLSEAESGRGVAGGVTLLPQAVKARARRIPNKRGKILFIPPV